MTGMRRLIISLCFALVLTLFVASSVSAHGFGERYDLPVPLDYFVVGAASTAALTFIIIGFFIRKGKQEYEYPHVNIIFCALAFRIFKLVGFLLGLLGVCLLGITIVAGLFGTADALDNFAPTFVWIIWWVGFAFFSILIGDLHPHFN